MVHCGNIAAADWCTQPALWGLWEKNELYMIAIISKALGVQTRQHRGKGLVAVS